MTYRSGRDKIKRKYLNIGLGIVAFLLFMYFWSAFKVAAYPLAEPVIRGYGVGKGGFMLVPSFITTYISSHKTLSQKSAQLEVEIERLENKVAEQEALMREMTNISSVAQLGSRGPIVVLYPIAEDITKLYSTILLSKGYREGIEKGTMVYIRGGQPVCDIIDVYERTSLCELLSKGDRITEGVTASTSVTLALVGAGGGSFIAETPNDTPVQVGEDVYVRSDQTYKVGTVTAIKKDDQATGSKVYIRGMYNPVHSSIFYVRLNHAP